jgi:general secretion pathway protein E
MLIDDPIRELVAQNVDAKRIKKQATASGMRTLRQDGARKVLRGLTSVAEVLRATEEETVVAEI